MQLKLHSTCESSNKQFPCQVYFVFEINAFTCDILCENLSMNIFMHIFSGTFYNSVHKRTKEIEKLYLKLKANFKIADIRITCIV